MESICNAAHATQRAAQRPHCSTAMVSAGSVRTGPGNRRHSDRHPRTDAHPQPPAGRGKRVTYHGVPGIGVVATGLAF